MQHQINRIEEAKTLIDRVIASQKSVDWWEAQVCRIMGQINELEQDEDANSEEIDKLMIQLNSILPRAKLELRTIDDLENQLRSFIEKQKQENKQESSNQSSEKNKLLSGNRRK
jgi:hypothetical protein